MTQLNPARSNSPAVVPTVQGDPDYAWLYKHATLLRLFKQTTDGRDQFWPQVPGLKNFYTRASIIGAPLPRTDIIIDHFLLEFEEGWVSLFGGTKENITPWIFHAVAAFDFPSHTRAWWPTYWYVMASECMEGDQAIMGTSNKPILFSGHSLGGATAICSAYLWGLIKPPGATASVSFGAPKARAVSGMNPANFTAWRVVNCVDVVPFLPFNLTQIPLRLLLLKIWAYDLYHYGWPVRLFNDGVADTVMPLSALPLIAVAAIQSNLTRHPFFLAHFMDAYAYELRMKMEREGILADPWYDMVNRYMNEADGRIWPYGVLDGVSAPSLPPTAPTPPPVEDTGARVQETLAVLNIAGANVLNPPRSLPVTEGQSLAAYVSQISGRTFADIEVRLTRQAIPDPANVTLASFDECSFNGYQRCGGRVWTMASHATWPAPRYATRAMFTSNGPDTPETAYGWYLVGILHGTRDEVLLEHQVLPRPFNFDRQRTLAIEVCVTGGTV